MASNVCWGVEVGAGAIKAVKLERTQDGVTVLDYALIPHKRVLSTPEIDEKEAKRVALGALISQYDLKGASLAVTVPGHSTFARFAKLPPVEPKKIPDIVKFEAVQQIPFPIDDVEWDYQTFVSPDSPDVEVGIFAMTREKVMEKLTEWQDLGNTPDVLTLSPLAAYNAISFDLNFTEQTPGTVILDVGTTSTDLIVAEGGRLWIRTFPIGGHQFTEALVTHFNLSYTKAEKLKREAERTEHARHVLQAMRPVFGDLAQDVQRSIGYYQSTHKNAKLTRLVGLGATFNLPGLRKFLSQQLQLEVVRLESWNRIKLENAEKNAAFQAEASLFASALGCALQGVGLETLSANLMPVPVIREAMWARKTPWFVAAACVGLMAGGASFIGTVMDRSAMASKPKPKEIEDAKREAAALTSKWKGVEGQYKADFRAPSTLALLQSREMYGHLLADLGAVMAAAKERASDPDDKPSTNRVQFRGWTTDYLTSPAAPDEQGNMQPIAAPPPKPGAAPAQSAAPVDPNADKPRVHIKLEIATSKPEAEADRFITETIVKWLDAHRHRDGTPYSLEFDSKKAYKVTKREKAPDAPVPSANPNPAPLPADPIETPIGEGDGEREPGRQPSTRTPQPAGKPGARQPFSNPYANRPGGAQPQQNQAKPGSEDVNKLAPLPPVDQIAPPGATISYYVVEWDAVLKLPDASKEAGK